MTAIRHFLLAALFAPSVLWAQATNGATTQSQPRVGPPKGTVIVVGGGSMGPEIYQAFINAAGGPDALIIDVPNAGGAASYGPDAGSTRSWRNAGAKNVSLLFTKDRKLADTDSFVDIVKNAGGVWFDGGRQWHIYNDYAGTKTEASLMAVLERGGVVGGSSAGASILGSFLVRGAPSSNNRIMDHPDFQKGFAYLRNTGIDQHVVARERLPDLADSIIPKYPNLLGISEDEGTAWVIRGDTGTIIGRSKAFVYGANVPNDPGKPFLTLLPGDKFDLGARRIIRRAIEDSPLTLNFVNGMFRKYTDPAAGGATVLVAQGGKVYVNQAYGIPVQPRLTPETTAPAFALGGIVDVFNSMCEQFAANAPARGPVAADSTGRAGAQPDSTGRGGGGGRRGGGGGGGGGGGTPATPFQNCVTRQIASPVGMQKTSATPDGQVQTNVDALYRMELGLVNPRSYAGVDRVKGWQADTFQGVTRYSAYGAPGGKRNAFVRIPDKQAVIIILTNDDSADAKGIADQISARLISGG